MREEMTSAEFRALLAKRGNKFGAIRTRTRDGYLAGSGVEAARWEELRLLELAGEIAELCFHPVFELFPARDGWPAVRYEADSQYWEQGKLIVEDVKGGKATQTPLFLLKARLLVEQRPHLVFRVVER